jgi:hypothetical protein
MPTEIDKAWLRGWQHDRRLTDCAAAAALALSLSSFKRQRNGRARVTRQTYLLAQYVSIHEPIWLEVAEIAYKLARVTGRPRARSDLMTQAKLPGSL